MMKIKRRYIVTVSILCIATFMILGGVIGVEAKRRRSPLRVEVSHSTKPSPLGGSIRSSGDYNIYWGSAMQGVSGVMDIASDPEDNYVYAIDGVGSRIAYCNRKENKWKVFCEIPDYIDRAERIAVYHQKPWVVTAEGDVYQMTWCVLGAQSHWIKHDIISRKASDIAIAPSKNSIYILCGDQEIFHYVWDENRWERFFWFPPVGTWYPGWPNTDLGLPLRIDIDLRTHYPWILTSKGYVFKYNPSYNEGCPKIEWWPRGRAFVKCIGDIAVYDEANLFIVGTNNPSYFGYHIYQHDIGKKWYKIPSGRLCNIAIDRGGEPWGVNSLGEVFHGVPNQKFPYSKAYYYVSIKSILYKDNHEDKSLSEQRINCFLDGKHIFYMEKNGVDDNEEVFWDRYLAFPNSQCPGTHIIKVGVEAYEYDEDRRGRRGSKEPYGTFIYDIDVQAHCDLGIGIAQDENWEIKYTSTLEVRSTPFP